MLKEYLHCILYLTLCCAVLPCVVFFRPFLRCRSSIARVFEAANISPCSSHPLCLVCYFLPFSKPPPFLFFFPLNSPAVSVASGLVFCGDISSVDASFMLWMVLETGFTAPAVMPQRLSLSRLAVKWSAGPPGRGDSQDITVKGFVTPCY